eukprot:m.126659 g.126659  ORF g.126659 m.126659 type:complete len:573 (+) comp13840_c0_seq1:354-2072(+)
MADEDESAKLLALLEEQNRQLLSDTRAVVATALVGSEGDRGTHAIDQGQSKPSGINQSAKMSPSTCNDSGSVRGHDKGEGEGNGEGDDLLQLLEAQNMQLLQDQRSITAIASSDPATKPSQRHRHSSTSSAHDSISVHSGDYDEGTAEQWAEVLANFAQWYKRKYKRLVDLCAAGIPPSLRCVVWRQLIDSYSRNERARVGNIERTDGAPAYAQLISTDSPHDKTIRRDISRTFPGHEWFRSDEGKTTLFNVIRAYSLYDTEVGYCQGSPFIIGLLLLQMPEEDAFDMFVLLMREYGLRGLYKPSMADLPLRLYQLEKVIQSTFPKLAEHFDEIGLKPSMYASQWFLTLFVSSLTLDCSLAVLDMVLVLGPDFVFNVALAIIGSNHDYLLRSHFEQVMTILSGSSLADMFKGRERNLIQSAQKHNVSKKRLAQHAQEYKEQLQREKERISELAQSQKKVARLEAENAALKAKLASLEKEYQALASKHLAVSVKLHDQEEKVEEMVIKMSREGSASSVTEVASDRSSPSCLPTVTEDNAFELAEGEQGAEPQFQALVQGQQQFVPQVDGDVQK